VGTSISVISDIGLKRAGPTLYRIYKLLSDILYPTAKNTSLLLITPAELAQLHRGGALGTAAACRRGDPDSIPGPAQADSSSNLLSYTSLNIRSGVKNLLDPHREMCRQTLTCRRGVSSSYENF
jgi:hypothetical protein